MTLQLPETRLSRRLLEVARGALRPGGHLGRRASALPSDGRGGGALRLGAGHDGGTHSQVRKDEHNPDDDAGGVQNRGGEQPRDEAAIVDGGQDLGRWADGSWVSQTSGAVDVTAV